MKQFILSCFLLIRLSQYHTSTLWSGMEGYFWRDKSIEIMLPVSCRVLSEVKEGENYLPRIATKGSRKNWEMKVVRKIIVEDGVEEFSCY